MKSPDNLIWIDLEMTGLKPDSDVIIDAPTAERRSLNFLAAWVEPKRSPMCGNSICQDRRFLARHMPSLEAFFHYRNLDVSTLKELALRWAPNIAEGFRKTSSHLALEDVRDSIRELQYYRERLLRTF